MMKQDFFVSVWGHRCLNYFIVKHLLLLSHDKTWLFLFCIRSSQWKLVMKQDLTFYLRSTCHAVSVWGHRCLNYFIVKHLLLLSHDKTWLFLFCIRSSQWKLMMKQDMTFYLRSTCHAFSVFGHCTWNDLPVWKPSLDSFRSSLQTFLFAKHY